MRTGLKVTLTVLLFLLVAAACEWLFSSEAHCPNCYWHTVTTQRSAGPDWTWEHHTCEQCRIVWSERVRTPESQSW